MKVLLHLIPLGFFLALSVFGQEIADETQSGGGRVTVTGADLELRVAMAQQADTFIRDLDQLAGEIKGIPFKIFLNIKAKQDERKSRVARKFLQVAGTNNQYQLVIDLYPGRGNAIDQEQVDRALLEMLLIERSLRSRAEDEARVEGVEIRPWLLDGIFEAIEWKDGRGDHRVYASLVDSGGWMEVEKLIDETRESISTQNLLSRELFRASSGALVMALLAQPQGTDSFGKFLNETATFEGEQITLLRKHFPRANLGQKGLERWWMLQVAAMSERRISDSMTIPETEVKLKQALRIRFRNERGRESFKTLDSWPEVLELETLEERVEAVRPAVDSLTKLSFRCFPTYRVVVGRYMHALSDLAAKKTEGIETAFENLETYRKAERDRYAKVSDLLDWYHISTVTEESGEFDDYLEAKEALERDISVKGDPLHEYLDAIQKIFEK